MALLNFKGHVTLLRVHDAGTKYGPPTDQIDAEVIFKFDNQPSKAFGFKLRSDTNAATHRGMLALLQSGFDHNWLVSTDVEIPGGKNNGISTRVWLSK